MDNEWKNSLRERFSDYSAPEPEGLWEGIEQGIAGKPRRKMLPVWLVSGATVAAAVALVVFLHPEKALESPDMQKQGTLAESVQADVAVPADTVANDTSSVEDASAPEVVSKPVPFGVVSRQTLLSEAAPVASVPVDEDRIPDAVPEMPDQVGHDEPTVPKANQAGHDEPTVPKANQVGNDEPVVSEADKTAQDWWDIQPGELEERVIIGYGAGRKKFSVGAYGNGGQESTELSKGYGMNRTAEYLTRAVGGGQKDVNGVVRMLSANRTSTFQAHHAAPLRVGMTASYGLTKHLNLVSGLNWTVLKSDFEESSGSLRTVTYQDLGYLGVPLRLEAAANVWKGLWVYAGAGGMVEKGLMGKSWTNTWVDGQIAESVENPKPDTGGLLWSVGANAGAEYRFSPHFGLYCTPGVEYHFDNGSSVRSAYTEKPLHWNVNLGLRFHFGI